MAGFFGFFDYTKPGKGVRKDEPQRSHFAMFWILLQRKFGKIIQLNILFLLFCLPFLAVNYLYFSGLIASTPLFLILLAVSILPVWPAVSGMTYVLRNFATQRPVFLLSDFWDAFKNNFMQSTMYGYMTTVAAYVLVVAGSFYYQSAATNSWMFIPFGFVIVIALTFAFANFYIPLMIVTLDLPLKSLIKNGFLLGTLCLKSNAITLLLVGIVVFLLWLFPGIGFLVYALIGFAFLAFLIIHNSYRGVKKYTVDPYLASLEAASKEAPDEIVFNDEQILPEEDKK
jgi:uncharacterized membrane protein YesL